MRQQAEILLDADLAAFLAVDVEMDVRLHDPDEAAQTQALRLAIPDPVTIITVAAAVADLAERLLKLARRTKTWLGDRGKTTTTLVVRGEDDDGVVEVSAGSNPEEIGRMLLAFVYEEPAE